MPQVIPCLADMAVTGIFFQLDKIAVAVGNPEKFVISK